MTTKASLLKIESHHVPELLVRKRLQEYGVGIFRTIHSRKGVKNAIKKGLIFINADVGYTGDWINGGETITLFQEPQTKKPSIDYELNVLYDDEYLSVVYKPAGILVSGNKRFTVENALSFNLKKSKQPDALSRPEPIHRLDYPTSGALLIGKTVQAVAMLNTMFEKRTISKTYAAVTIGDLSESGSISVAVDEKPSESEYIRLLSIPSERFGQLNLTRLQPHTGRRHQLRKHLESVGHPILGDAKYYKEGLILEGKGLYLHATSLLFEHPITGVRLAINAPLPKKFLKLFSSANAALGIE